jgi:hypothetical protein
MLKERETDHNGTSDNLVKGYFLGVGLEDLRFVVGLDKAKETGWMCLQTSQRMSRDGDRTADHQWISSREIERAKATRRVRQCLRVLRSGRLASVVEFSVLMHVKAVVSVGCQVAQQHVHVQSEISLLIH